eukprot:5671441-Amphidinium_carterae.1
MAEVTFRGLCEKHARVSASLTKGEVRESRAQAAVEDSISSNLLIQYSLDLTPIRARRFLPTSSSSRGARSAIATHELLVQWLQ